MKNGESSHAEGYDREDPSQTMSSLDSNRLKVDMTMMVMQDLNDGEDAPRNSKNRFPSLASLSSSIWSSSGYSSETSESYAWSASLGSSDSGSSSDYSSFSGSDDDESSDEDSDELEEARDQFPAKRPIPPMPPPMPEGLPIGLGGLPMSLESLKRDLEKVGRAIISSNAGNVAAERAQTLASINWLASHVPNAVLDHLGHETRALIDEEKGGSTSDDSKGSRVASVVTSDAMSDVSDLSEVNLKEFGINDENAVDASEGTDLGPTSESYGDLADIAQAKASMFLPGSSDPSVPRIEEEITPGMMKPSDQSGLMSMGILGNLPETDFSPHKKASRSHSMPGLEHSFGLENSERAKFSKRSSTIAEGGSAQMGIIDMLPQSTGDTEPHNYLSNGGPKTHRRASTSGKDPSKNGIDTSQRSLFSRRASSKTDKRPSLKTFVSPSKKVKGIFKRFSKRRDSNGKDDALDINGLTNGSFSEADPESGSFASSSVQGSDESQSLAASSNQDSISMKKKKVRGKIHGTGLPHSNSYRCALLFADISGFTKLSTLLDPESLSKAINAYFQLIVNEVLDGKGDILKFAGDAVFIEWKATEEVNLESCVEQAVQCAAKIVSSCSDYSVLSNGTFGGSSCLVTGQATKVDTLNVHCGIGAGQMIGVHVGDHELRREYILLGQPIQQATVATEFAKLGEVAVSPDAYKILSRVCDFEREAFSDGKCPTVVATRNRLMFASKRRMGVHQPKIVNDVSRGVTRHVEGLEVEALRKYRRKMSLYVHPVVVDNDLAAAGDLKNRVKRLQKSAQERHREEAEIRNVYVMFVNPLVQTRTTNNARENHKIFKTLNDVMNLSSREIKRFSGHLRQFIVDDKGLVMIITFGLRGTTIPNMVALRALPATISIFNALQMELGIQCKIGATIGEAYCGVVGGVKRHEYAVLGPSVNLAARLMTSKMNPGILVDNRVRMMAHRSYGFNALPPVVAKGYAEPVPIFEPLSPLERAWGRIQPNFVGRKDEIMKIMGMARDMVLNESPSKFVIVESRSGMGKTTMVAHSIEHIRKLMGANKHRLVVTKKVSRDSDALVPFGIFRSILVDVLKSFRECQDDKSYKSGGSIYSSLQHSIAWESLSGHSLSQASTGALPTTQSSDVIRNICNELDMPPSFVEHALHELLGVERPKGAKTDSKAKPPSTKAMISFMARAFKRCTQDARLVVVALDDLHNADELSWKVCREIFETVQNVLFIGSTYQTDEVTLKVEQDFWDELNQKYREDDRFVTMKLGSLNREEITSMIMKTLGLQRKEVKDDVLEGVAIQSGGMPHFVNEILEHVKRQMALDSDFEITDISYESFGDLVLQRLDSFDLHVRNVLNIGAVIGLSFTLDEVVGVEIRTSDGTKDAVQKITEEALSVAVEEGILECKTFVGDGESDGILITKYAFYHAVWRTALLNIMLEGRKRDLHRVLAETLEEQDVGVGDYMFNTKLFNHWTSSGNFGKAAELALMLGKHFEERLGLPAQSIRLYNEALDLLRETTGPGAAANIGGFSKRVLSEVRAEDLTSIIQLQVALGEALAMAQQMNESVTSYQDALRITQAAAVAKELVDRSILFPVFTGLSLALKRGHIVQDPECKYEQAMLRRYVQETKLHGDPIYIIHSITLQAEMYSRFGDYEKGLACLKEIEPLYDVEEHSLDLCDEYGCDLGAQSFATSTLWYVQLGMAENALATCWFVIESLLPKVEKRNVHASFMIIYPVLWVLKDNGFALEAREAFEEFVCEAYTQHYGEGRSTFFLPLYDPILMLLDLAGNADTDPDMMEEYYDWALDIDNLGFGTLINSKTGELGRNADSIAAEICYILSQQTEDEDARDTLIENGIEIASEDLEFAREKKLAFAEKYAADVLRKLGNS